METISLTLLKDNEFGRVKEINRCGNAQKRLHELGLYKNAEVKMLKNDKGPIIISLSGSKLALGRNLADNIQIIRQ